MTKNLKKFSVIMFVYSLVNFAVINQATSHPESAGSITFAANLSFIVLVYNTINYFYQRDKQAKVRYTLWTRYVQIAVVIPYVVGSIILYFLGHSMKLSQVLVSGLIVGLIVFVTALVNQGKIKGIEKKELFK